MRALEIPAGGLGQQHLCVRGPQRGGLEAPLRRSRLSARERRQRVAGLADDRGAITHELAGHEHELLVVVVHDVHDVGRPSLDQAREALFDLVARHLPDSPDRLQGQALVRRPVRGADVTLTRPGDAEVDALRERVQVVDVTPLEPGDDRQHFHWAHYLPLACVAQGI